MDDHINRVIKHQNVEELAALLRVKYPLAENKIESFHEYFLLNKCDVDGLTPLMNATRFGKKDCLSLLLSCGADVNVRTPSGKSAIDFSLDQNNPDIILLLFTHDSLFPDLEKKDRKDQFLSLMNKSMELQQLFNDRNNIHEELVKKPFCSELKNNIDQNCIKYFVNDKGESLLYKAGFNRKYEAWAFMVSKGMQYATNKEKEDMERVTFYYKDEFHRALEKYYYTVNGCHVMKMVAKSIRFGNNRRYEDEGKKVESFYKFLDEHKMTSVLLQVLQDDEELTIAFDFDSKDLKRMLPSCPDGVAGLTDLIRNRIYIQGVESGSYCLSDLLGTLAHELTHQACKVVFQNFGLPYRKGDEPHQKEYQKILHMLTTESALSKCPEIIKRIKHYEKSLWEPELIVRVPEIIASCKCEAEGNDGVSILNETAPELLKYFADYVMPEFSKYVNDMYTSNRITRRTLIGYQGLLSVHQEEGLEMSQKTKNVEFSKHNELKCLEVSSLKLGRCHLRMFYQECGKSILFVDWSQFMRCETLFIDGLNKNDIELLVVIWDSLEGLHFCKHETCWEETCPAHHFSRMTENVVLLVDMKLPFLVPSQRVDYFWNDLSKKTKDLILDKDVNFGGSYMPLKNIILSVIEEAAMDEFMSHCLPSDISQLLEESLFTLGKPIGWTICSQACEIFNNHPDCFIPRSLSQKYVKLSKDLLKKEYNSLFFVSNTSISHLLNLGINAEYLHSWNDEEICASTRCYVYDSSLTTKDEFEVFEEVVKAYSTDKRIKKMYHLRFHSGYFLLSNSADSNSSNGMPDSGDSVEDHEKNFIFTRKVGKLLEDSSFSNDEPTAIVIADDPGCGKSFFLNKIAIEMKEKIPEAWVILVDLKSWAKGYSLREFWNHQDSNDDSSDVLDYLFDKIKVSSTAFEKRLFKIFSQRKNKVVIMFDGFDEICPDRREPFTSLLVTLKTMTRIKICVTTRLHEKHDLVKSLNGISFKLVPLSTEEQIKFLNNYWNRLFKNLPSKRRLDEMKELLSGIQKWIAAENEDPDLVKVSEELAKNILRLEKDNKCAYDEVNFEKAMAKLLIKSNLICGGVEQFTQTPLHVQIIGFIIFNDFMSIGKSWNLGFLYQRIFDLKLDVFHSEKAGSNGSIPAEVTTRMAKETASKTLQKLSSNIFNGHKENDSEQRNMDDAIAIGVVTEKSGDYHFVHRTFCEYFFAKWLLRKAKKKEVTRLWIDRIFFEENFSVVRLFLEDLLCLKSSGTEGFTGNGVTLSKSVLDQKESSGMEKENIHKCVYALILDWHPEILQFFADSLGKSFVELFLEDANVSSWQLTEGLPLTKALKNYKDYYSRAQNLNPFTFSSYCLQKITNIPPEKYVSIVNKLFYLIGTHNLLHALNRKIMEHGMSWILPCVHEQKQCANYLEAIVNFFIGEQREAFRETLTLELLESYQIWFSVIGEGVILFNLMTKLADAILDSFGFEKMLLINSDFFELWIGTVRYRDFKKVKHVWSYVEGKLTKEKRIEFLMRKGYKNYNVLTQAVMNKDLKVVKYIWDLAACLMGDEKSKQWLCDSFSKGKPKRLDCKNAPSGIYNFFNLLCSSGTGEVISKILLSDDGDGSHFYLTFRCYYDMMESLLSLYDLISQNLHENKSEVVRKINVSFSELVKWLSSGKYSHVGENQKKKIDEEFKKISSNYCAQFNELHYDQNCFMDLDSWDVMTCEGIKN
ncbi:uncharacterized protein LOC124165699 isoform X2 [Ischnura elegans]|uniref:uncharacterized protein LOC124165699 isoform X2 n=1 Tax=Ischnura elegans TaxID=197161 RepID=UPI001ED8B0EC|nr:uncharacterized protein LOC124165699 isoform X2 [Ischnura elegans]